MRLRNIKWDIFEGTSSFETIKRQSLLMHRRNKFPSSVPKNLWFFEHDYIAESDGGVFMELNEFQKISTEMIENIDKKANRNHDVDLTIVHLVEELGEIARIIYNEKTKRVPVSKEAIGGEFVDSLMLLAHLASKFDINLEQATDKKIEELKKRFDL